MGYIPSSSYIKLGIFVTLVFIIAIFTLVWIILWTDKSHYKIIFEDSIAGIEEGAPVKFRGVRVGRVDSIELNPKNAEEIIVEISVKKGTPIKEDSIAKVQLQSGSGLSFIEISKGSKTARLLEPGSIIKAGGKGEIEWFGETPSDITLQIQLLLTRLLRLTEGEGWSKVEHILLRVDELLTNLDRLVLNLVVLIQENRTPLNQTLVNLAMTSKEAKETLAEIRGSWGSLTKELRETLDESKKTFVAIRSMSNSGKKTFEDIDTTVNLIKGQFDKDELRRVISSLVLVLESLSITIREFEGTVSGSRKDIKKILQDIKEVSQKLKELATNLRDNPSLLLDSNGLPERKIK